MPDLTHGNCVLSFCLFHDQYSASSPRTEQGGARRGEAGEAGQSDGSLSAIRGRGGLRRFINFGGDKTRYLLSRYFSKGGVECMRACGEGGGHGWVGVVGVDALGCPTQHWSKEESNLH